jgi:hypothetical protein
MISRIAVLAVVLALLAPASAVAQTGGGSPFGPLPPAQPTPTPPPEEQDDPLGQEDVGRTTLYVIAGVILIGFVAVGAFISRDARRSLPRDHRPDAGRLSEEGPHRRQREAKARARARGKAQKAARRRNR